MTLTYNSPEYKPKQLARPTPIKKNSLLSAGDLDMPRSKSTPPSHSHLHERIEHIYNHSLMATNWSPKQFFDLQTFGCQELLEEAGDINEYSPEDFEQLNCMQHRVFHSLRQGRIMNTKDLELYKLFSQLFDTSYEQAKRKVSPLHEKFKEAFHLDTTPAYDSKTGIVALNFDQLHFAQKLIEQAFPGFIALSQNPKQNRQVAHLLQLVIMGDQIIFPPESAEVFEVKEVGGWWGNGTKASFPMLARPTTFSSIMGLACDSQPHLREECRKGLDFFIQEFIEGAHSLEIGNYSTTSLEIDQKNLASFLNYFAETIIEHVKEIERSFPNTTKFSLHHFCKNLANTFSLELTIDEITSLDEKADEIIREAFLFLHPIETNALEEVVSRVSSRLPLNKKLMIQIIQLKFIEFTLFWGTNYEEAFAKEIRGFYNEYTGSNSENPIRLRRTLLRYRFDAKLAPECCDVQFQLYFPNSTTYNFGISESCGENAPICQVTSSLTFEYPFTRCFYFNTGPIKKENAFKQCFWSWRTPERLVEYTLKKICPLYYEKSLKKRLNIFVCSLRKLEKIQEGESLTISSDHQITITPPSSSWSQTLSYYMNWTSSDEEATQSTKNSHKDETLVARLKSFIQEGISIYEEYTRRQKLLYESDKHPPLMISYQLANLLEGAIKGLKTYISTRISEGQVEVKDVFTSLIQWIETDIQNKLPSSSSTIEGLHQGPGFITTIKNGLFESNNGEDIDWKIKLYQSILKQLRLILKQEIISREIDNHDRENPIDSFLLLDFSHPGMKGIQELLSDLFKNIDISVTSREQFTQYYLWILRNAYATNFVKKFRRCSDIFDEQPDFQGIRILRAIGYFLCTSINLDRECKALNQKFFDLGTQLMEHNPTLKIGFKPTGSYLLERIDILHYFFHEVGSNHKTPEISKWLKSLKDHWNFNFDPNTQGNLPHKLADILISDGEKVKNTSCIACGSTTVEGWVSYAQKNQEFQRAMEQYRENEMRHLFVINQDLRAGSCFKRLKGGNETDRINAILGMTEGLEDTFFPIVLSKNSA
ncbi:MAG: hypothetical protein AAGG81_05830, partial [Chlamydiota bacterium]